MGRLSIGWRRSPTSNTNCKVPEQGTRLLVPALENHNLKGAKMDREHVKGVADKAKGAIKETAGKVSGDKELETEGKVDKAKGDLHNAAGDVKDAVKKVVRP